MKNKLLIAFSILFSVAIPSLYSQNSIRMEVFRGEAIKPYIKDITDLCITIYKEHPYLYEGTEEEYLPFIEHYTQSVNGLACLIFDNERPVGVAIGMPMNEMREKYKQPFIDARQHENSAKIFYLGELILLKDYRRQGFGKQMYLEFERTVSKNKKFKKICFCKIEEVEQSPSTSKGYKALDNFLHTYGFEKCADITVNVSWRNVGERDDSPHKLVYWLKSISKH